MRMVSIEDKTNLRRPAIPLWNALGDVEYFAEPFAETIMFVLGRPNYHRFRNEILVDKNRLIVNMLRAIRHEPLALAEYTLRKTIHFDGVEKAAIISGLAEGLREDFDSSQHYYDLKAAACLLSEHVSAGKMSVETLAEYSRMLLERSATITFLDLEWDAILADLLLKMQSVRSTVGLFLDPPSNVAPDVAEQVVVAADRHPVKIVFARCKQSFAGSILADAGWVSVKAGHGFWGGHRLSAECYMLSPACNPIPIQEVLF